MTAHCKYAGSWRNVDSLADLRARAAGNWQPVLELWARASGAWVKVWQRIEYAGKSVTDSRPSGLAVAKVGFRRNGSWYTNTATNGTVERGDWLKFAGASGGDDYQLKFSYSGDAPTGVAFNSWLDVNQAREVSLSTSAGFKQASVTVQARKKGQSAVRESAVFNLDVDVA